MNIYGLTMAELKAYFINLGENPAKAPIIFTALYRNNLTDFHQLTQLKGTLREQLAKDFSLTLPRLVTQKNSETASKFLFALADGQLIEAVLMRQVYGNSLCLSTQVGCNMACAFCQSGRFKKVRNLTTHEMIGQIIAVNRLCQSAVNNVVLMGIGEPLDNYDAVMDFITIITTQQGLNIAKKHITLSTCGLVDGIKAYADSPNWALLAVSLHAPNDELRSQLMPINRRYPMEALSEAIDYYLERVNKKVMLEYILLKDLNDSAKHAHQLADWIGCRKCHVNLINYNETQNLGFAPTAPENARAFYEILKERQIAVTTRREFGASLKAACGQLRADYQNSADEVSDF